MKGRSLEHTMSDKSLSLESSPAQQTILGPINTYIHMTQEPE